MMFGEHLTERHIVPPSAVTEALSAQRYVEVPVGRILRDFGHLNQATLDKELSDYLGPKIRTDLAFVHAHLASTVEENLTEWAGEHDALIFRNSQGQIVLVSPRWNDRLLETFQHRWSSPAVLFELAPSDFEALRNTRFLSIDRPSGITIERSETDDERLAKSDPFTSLFRDVIEHAHERKASDVHIEPTAQGLTVRVRLHGELAPPYKTLPSERRDAFIRHVKKLANLSISVSGRPQDSRMRLAQKNLNLRVNLFPVLHGEKICLRLLDQNQSFHLDRMEFEPDAFQVMNEALHQSHGVILISGPTGSGKTTTLYSLLTYLDSRKKNIVTLEDPVEYELSGINQGQITKSMTFAQGLRSILRQDPDVILVGEIRDGETADLCFKAASTGHLVLSTLHANNASEVVNRLLGLDVERELILSNLRLAIAQRLAQKLCPRCRVPYETHDTLPPHSGESAHLFTRGPTQRGCTCMEGVIGRLPIVDWMTESHIRSMVKGGEIPVEGIQKAYLRRAYTGDIDAEGVRYAA